MAYFALYLTCLKRQSASHTLDCHGDKHIWEECQFMDLNRRKEELQSVKQKMRQEQ